MSWHYRNPTVFPASYGHAIRQAVSAPQTKIVLASFPSRRDAEAAAESFRWFKWCCRQKNAIRDLFDYTHDYDIRSSISSDSIGFVLFVSARPTKIAEFIRCNPDLAANIMPKVNGEF